MTRSRFMLPAGSEAGFFIFQLQDILNIKLYLILKIMK